MISWNLDDMLHTITMPIAPHNNVAHLHVDLPDDAYSAYIMAAGLLDDWDPITLNPPPTAVVTEDKASVSTDASHPNPEEEWHDDWTIPDSEGATTEGAMREADFEFAKDDPQSEVVAVDLMRRRSWRVCQLKCCGSITSSTTSCLERFEPWHALE
jgi:hypothetical protein